MDNNINNENKNIPKKKDLSGPMATGYDPVQVEKDWYQWWNDKGYFTVDNKSENKRGKFVMVIPPPNVTGSLHIGHALTISVEDSITRWHRMCGRDALWIPGTDHAGIATQVVVEKKLKKEENKSRYDYGREEFIKRVWQWKEVYGNRITDQIRRMGASVDWSRESFTMDQKLSKAVTEAFVRMVDKKKIYRATRLVNWSCALQSAISNIEVEYVELDKRKKLDVPGYSEGVVFGGITSFAYKVKGSDEEIVVATTRPETMLGDTAVAVHPDDKRYTHLIGKELVHPFIEGRRIIVVADKDLVDMTFGTGAVKVTPAHDPNDFECGKRNKLEFINILTDDGRINENGGKFQGMKRFDARIEVIKGLKELKLFKETKDNKMSIGICSRSKDIIEPLLKPQWYVDLREPAKRSIEAFNNGDLKIYPNTLSSDWNRWLEKTEDWCISRQLWWGHRIPAYLIWPKDQNKPNSEDINNWFIARTREEAVQNAIKKLNKKEDELIIEQDEDVLDTWFSSGLFPFSVFGWPENTQDLKKFYPGFLLETGRDILFFWVARMVMMGLELTDQLPFKEVFLHAMVRDASGRKMSKSLGNVVDPIDVIEGITLENMQKQLHNSNLPEEELKKALEDQKKNFKDGIKQCGTDALRFSLCDYTSHGRDINLDVPVIESYRNWCNKLWNVTKFALGVLGENFKPNKNIETSPHLIDQWILSRLSVAAKLTNKAFKTYAFSVGTRTLYNFWMNELCDVYIEAIKPIVYGKLGVDKLTEEEDKNRQTTLQTLYTCLEVGLKLLHPFMPYVTEELYQRLPQREGAFESIMISPYPQILQANINELCEVEDSIEGDSSNSTFYNATIEKEFEYIEKINKEIRSAKSMYMKGNIKKQDPRVFVRITNTDQFNVFKKFKSFSNTLVWCSDINLLSNEEDPEGSSLTIVDEHTKVYVELSQLGLDYGVEIQRLESTLKKLQTEAKRLNQKMQGKQYTEKVPQEVQEQDSKRKISLEGEERMIISGIEQFKKLLNKK